MEQNFILCFVYFRMPPRSKHKSGKKTTKPTDVVKAKKTAEQDKETIPNSSPQPHFFIPFSSVPVVGHQTNVYAKICQDIDAKCCELRLAVYSHGLRKIHAVQLPNSFEEQLALGDRVVGKQMCIGSRHPVYLVQYITVKHKYLRYLLVDLSAKTQGAVQCFEDKIGYFDKSYQQFLTECHVSPDFSWVLFRLPRQVLGAKRRFSKLPAVNREHEDLGVKDEGLQDRFDMALAFDPLQPAEYTFITVNLYCTSCQISRQRLKPQSCELVKKQVMLPVEKKEKLYPYQQNDYYTLARCSAEYSRSGRWLVIALMSYKGTSQAVSGPLMLHIIDRETLEVVDSSHTTEGLTSIGFEYYLQPPVFDCVDENVSIWASTSQQTRVIGGLTVKLPQALMSLQEQCRRAILRCDVCKDIELLPLPNKLKSFLSFEYHPRNEM